jgi:hypothetical protein
MNVSCAHGKNGPLEGKMIDKTLFHDLKNYLTKEFLNLSKKKDEKLAEKVTLEMKKKREEQQLFDYKDTEQIKRLFSPLEDEIFEIENSNSYKNDKILQKIQEIENEIIQMEESMEKIKSYLSFIGTLETSSLEESERTEEVKSEETVNLSLEETLNKMAENLQKKHSETEILLDFDGQEAVTDDRFNTHFAKMLSQTIETSFKQLKIDAVILEGKTETEKVTVSLQMLLGESKIDQCSYQYEVILKK